MNTKQILLVGGGTAFGAIAAVGLMNVLSPTGQDTTNPGTGSGPRTEVTENTTPASKSADAARGGANVGPILDELAQNVPEIDPAELEGRRDEFRDAMRERQMERLTTKMAKWSAALGLDEGQQEKLLDIANNQFDELEQLATNAEGGNPDPAALSESAKRAMAIMSGRAMEESMAGVLTPAQQEKFEAFGNRQNESRAEARTLRQLATLQEDLMLTPEQRNDVYGIIYEDNLKEVEGNSDVSSMIDQFASQAGVTIDPSLQGMISSLANRGLEEMASGKELNEESVQDMAESALNDSINQQVNQLRPVLTDAQLELYKSQLEGRLRNIGNMIPRGDGNGGGE
jgi:hypothetical protein